MSERKSIGLKKKNLGEPNIAGISKNQQSGESLVSKALENSLDM